MQPALVLAALSIRSWHFYPGLSEAGLPDPNSYPRSGTMGVYVSYGVREIGKGRGLPGRWVETEDSSCSSETKLIREAQPWLNCHSSSLGGRFLKILEFPQDFIWDTSMDDARCVCLDLSSSKIDS
ncbi:hypothetical protein WN48_03295 [Eufriesea mexicana]|uniref:Uncharacterized protein n=1 Tax=Eufriesea mexicana TaxID=516756 RepID=A0A310SPS5_9HYME|nr:hypothetical protein WN48_03295 [Eufriesea mexicana]